MKGIIFTDGGARPTNPGHAGFACIIDIEGKEYKISRYIGWRSNNQAEYFGVIVGLKYAKELGVDVIVLNVDSQLVRNHMLGIWKIKQNELKPLAWEALELISGFKRCKINWVKRDKNKRADGLCTSAIYAGIARNPFALNYAAKGGKEIDPFASNGERVMPKIWHQQANNIIRAVNMSKM